MVAQWWVTTAKVNLSTLLGVLQLNLIFPLLPTVTSTLVRHNIKDDSQLTSGCAAYSETNIGWSQH